MADDVLTEADLRAAIEALQHTEPSVVAPFLGAFPPWQIAEIKAILKMNLDELKRIGIYESHNLVSGK